MTQRSLRRALAPFVSGSARAWFRERAYARRCTCGTDVQREVAAAVARERRRIADELHDIVGHRLVVIATLSRRTATLSPALGPQLRHIDEAAQAPMSDIREVLGVLRKPDPTTVDVASDPTLADMLARVIAWVPRDLLPVELLITGADAQVPPDLAHVLQRIVQECLT